MADPDYRDLYNDRTILNAIHENPNYENETLFNKIFTNRYPLLIKYKNTSESWKQFYLRMIHAISTLEEKYGIPYIPHPDFDPTDLNYSMRTRGDGYNKGMYYAAELGDLDLVKYFISKGADSINIAMAYASRGGQNDVFKFFIRRGASDFYWPLKYAAMKNHRHIVDYILSLKPHWDKMTLNNGMAGAAEGGHRDLVELFIQRGADNWIKGATGAARGGHEDLVDFFMARTDRREDLLDSVLVGAAEGGHIHLVEKSIKLGATRLGWALASAAANGHKNVVEFLLKSRTGGLTDAILGAAQEGHEDIVIMLLNKGANIKKAIEGARNAGRMELVEKLTRMEETGMR